MCQEGVRMVSKSGYSSSQRGSVPDKGKCVFASQFWYYEPAFKY